MTSFVDLVWTMDNLAEAAVLLIITGASRGFGRALALEFGWHCGQQWEKRRRHKRRSKDRRHTEEKADETRDQNDWNDGDLIHHLMLLTRSPIEDNSFLDDIQKNAMQAAGSHDCSTDPPPSVHDKARPMVRCSAHGLDFSDLDQLESALSHLFDEVVMPLARGLWVQSKHLHLVLVNNHGSLGYLGPAFQCPSLQLLRSSIDLNVTSSLWLTMQFEKFVHELQMSDTQRSGELAATVVNVSSLVALQPFPTMSVYSAGKAAREAFHISLSKEDHAGDENGSHSPVMKVLNYAPGPMSTRMADELRDTETVQSSIRSFYREENSLVNPRDSAAVLIRLLFEDGVSFGSGQHIDYFDVVKSIKDNRQDTDI
jgi:NAD(P)-dependent dehydrogenase (short-subunit alcohol dehydrogenase family)